MDKLLSLKRVTELLGISRQSVLKLIHSKQLRAYRISDRLYKVAEREIERYLRDCQTASEGYYLPKQKQKKESVTNEKESGCE